MGIIVLTLALVLSGFLGITQDKTYSTYVRVPQKSPKKSKQEHRKETVLHAEPWQESMFYMHFLSMPLFVFAREDLMAQASTLSGSPAYNVVLPTFLQGPVLEAIPFVQPKAASLAPPSFSLPIPSAYVYLFLNTLTQLVCVSGVHRLTSRVSSLTVTLVLVVRKAVSLLISVLLFGSGVEGKNKIILWAGASCVFAGTLLYSIASTGQKKDGGGAKLEKKQKDE